MTATMLVVDDEQEITEMLSRHFRYLGYTVLTASNGREALAKLAAQKIDIVVSDIMMPEMNGVELLKQVRMDYPMIRPIMMTGYVTQENALACIRYGADAFVFKPLSDIGEMESAVNDAVKRLRYWNTILKELRGMKAD